MSSFPLLGAPLFFLKKQLQYLLFVCTTKSTVVVQGRATDVLRVSFTLESNQTSTATLTRVLCSVSTLFNTVTDKVTVGTFSYNGEVLEIKHPNSDGAEIVTKQ